METYFSTAYQKKSILSGVFVLLIICLSNLYNYLLFHSLAELFSIAIACGIFMIAWNSKEFNENNYVIFLGIAYLFIGILDMFHMLSYKGMGVFKGYDADLPTQLWIAARYTESLTLLSAPFFIAKKINIPRILFVYFFGTIVLLASIFYWDVFPDCFVEGAGLTSFKKFSEYIISLILAGSFYLLFKKKTDFYPSVFKYLAGAIFLTICAELSFTFYVSVYGFSNMVGHLFKIFSFYLIYKAIIYTGLKKPYSLMFKEISEKETRYRQALETTRDGFWLLSDQGRLIDVNEAYCIMSGYTRKELLQFNIADLEVDESADETAARIKRIIENGSELFETRHRRKNGSVFDVEISVTFLNRDNPAFVCICHDITASRLGKTALIESEAAVRNKLNAILDPDGDISTLNLSDVMDFKELQIMMEDFYKITKVTSAVLDISGKVVVNVGWQDICTKFHRSHPDTCKNCLESDTILSNGVPVGEFKTYRCKNNMWDMVTPIEVGGRHLGNIFVGQFFYEEDIPDYDLFRNQARQYGFDEKEYLAALDRVPRLSRETVDAIMTFYARFTAMISTLGYSKINLSRAISRQEELLREISKSEEDLKESQRIAHVGSWRLDISTNKVAWSEELYKMYGFDPSLPPPSYNEQHKIFTHESWDKLSKALPETIETGIAYELELETVRKDGSNGWMWVRGEAILDAKGKTVSLRGAAQDITESKAKEKDRLKLRAQLQQAQKMESVGRLAGGVAHDFNNMLGVILGHTEMVMEQMDSSHLFFLNLQEIQKAAVHSAALTRQLLAFARKQTVSPKVLDLNKTVDSMLNMLERLIGEDIDLAWLPGKKMWPVKIDPSQIDQILANLCVNARDAIAGVGKLTIETSICTFDESYCAVHPGFMPGEYVLLTVSDNGSGMDAETQANIFEPFFTTKPMDKGTGLGLATVYGIVKQNNGFINVYSEPDQGTTFKIYLARHTGKADQIQQKIPGEPVSHGNETILLVEDEPAILDLTTMMLQRLGYTVLAASTPGEAIHLAREHMGKIDLLMTDVIMPEMNGRDLARNLLALYPTLKRLFMSGYTANVIAHHGVLDEGVHFIQKPFSKKDLTDSVKKVLDEKRNTLKGL